jgi:hypothetical protein
VSSRAIASNSPSAVCQARINDSGGILFRGILQKFGAIVALIRSFAPPLTVQAQGNGGCERFHKTVLDEFYPFRKKLYASIDGRRISIYGSEVTMRRGHIKGAGALAKRRRKLSLTPSRLRRKK